MKESKQRSIKKDEKRGQNRGMEARDQWEELKTACNVWKKKWSSYMNEWK